MLRRILLFVPLAGFLVWQAFPSPRPAPRPPSPTEDFLALYRPPAEIAEVLRAACYDCHSWETKYPWYSRLQPVGMWLHSHIEEGRGELNFSTFGALSPKRAARRLEACADEIENQAMPLPSYTWTHASARLSPAQRTALITWFRHTEPPLPPSP